MNNNNSSYLQTLTSYFPSPYYLYAFVFDDEKYNPMLKFLLLELSPVITILYPTFYYLLPSSVLNSLDDEFMITLISPIVLHVKRPEYHYQGIISSATSIIYSSAWLLYSQFYGIVEDEKEREKSLISEKAKYELKINEDFLKNIKNIEEDIETFVPETLMDGFKYYYSEPLEMNKINISTIEENVTPLDLSETNEFTKKPSPESFTLKIKTSPPTSRQPKVIAYEKKRNPNRRISRKRSSLLSRKYSRGSIRRNKTKERSQERKVDVVTIEPRPIDTEYKKALQNKQTTKRLSKKSSIRRKSSHTKRNVTFSSDYNEPSHIIVTPYEKPKSPKRNPTKKHSLLRRKTTLMISKEANFVQFDYSSILNDLNTFNLKSFDYSRILYAFIVFPLYIIIVIPLNVILYSTLAISVVYLLKQQWFDEGNIIQDPIKRERYINKTKLSLFALSIFFAIMIGFVAPLVLFFLGFKAAYIAVVNSLEDCIYFSFKMAIGYSEKDFKEKLNI